MAFFLNKRCSFKPCSAAVEFLSLSSSHVRMHLSICISFVPIPVSACSSAADSVTESLNCFSWKRPSRSPSMMAPSRLCVGPCPSTFAIWACWQTGKEQGYAGNRQGLYGMLPWGRSETGVFSISGGLLPFWFADPEKKKAWEIRVAAFAHGPIGAQARSKVFLLGWPGREVPTVPRGNMASTVCLARESCLSMAAPAHGLFFFTESRTQAQKCHLAAVASSLLLCVPLLCILCKETITKRRKKS